MNRSIRVALVVAIAALTIPTIALATQGDGTHNSHGHSHHGRSHRGHSAPAGTGAGTVTSYSDGTLIVALEHGGSITGSVTRETHFECQNADRGQLRAVFAPADTAEGGTTRATGATGATSATDGTGVTGDTGLTGATDNTGASGDTGASGWTGSTGSTGRGKGTAGTGDSRGHGDGATAPCDSSLLTSGAEVVSAGVLLDSHGVSFRTIELLAAVQ